MTKPTILLASDHNGLHLKEALTLALTQLDIPWLDFGPITASPPTDYNIIAAQVANSLVTRNMVRKDAKAILCCGTGIGLSIAANKIPGCRAAVAHSRKAAAKSREHNDTNALCLGAWMNSMEENLAIALEWLNTPFGEGRHVRRVEHIAPQPEGKIVLANGVFDLLHKGHIEMLRWAAALGDYLIVAINSDASVRAIKGPSRPVNSQDDRRAVLQALEFVDEVLVFDEPSPDRLIRQIMPSFLVRGGDFAAAEVRERDQVPEGVEIKIFPKVADYSTTSTIAKARSA